MSENMVERVARAIAKENNRGSGWDMPAEFFEGMARAAIEAMREPTSWMLNEAVQIYEDQAGNVAGHEYWQRMVCAALKEEVKG